MKEIKAYIKPHRLSKVTLALQKIEGLTGMSVSTVRGFGRGRAADNQTTVMEDFVPYVEHARIEIFCKDDLVEEIIAAIQGGARTGLRGDGKIYVQDVQCAVRIGTGERGETAA